MNDQKHDMTNEETAGSMMEALREATDAMQETGLPIPVAAVGNDRDGVTGAILIVPMAMMEALRDAMVSGEVPEAPAPVAAGGGGSRTWEGYV